MKHEDQIEFYSCPLCGRGTGNDIDGAQEHECMGRKLSLKELRQDFKNELGNNKRGTLEMIDDYLDRAFKLGYEYQTPREWNPCPLTNSSHEKALVRVVEETKILAIDDKGKITASECTEFIQVLCACGYTISACEIKNK